MVDFRGCDDVITLCLAPPTERFLHSDDDHESEVGQDSKAAQAGQQDGGDSLLLSNSWTAGLRGERGDQTTDQGSGIYNLTSFLNLSFLTFSSQHLTTC